jgi:hypothetical protein
MLLYRLYRGGYCVTDDSLPLAAYREHLAATTTIRCAEPFNVNVISTDFCSVETVGKTLCGLWHYEVKERYKGVLFSKHISLQVFIICTVGPYRTHKHIK